MKIEIKPSENPWNNLHATLYYGAKDIDDISFVNSNGDASLIIWTNESEDISFNKNRTLIYVEQEENLSRLINLVKGRNDITILSDCIEVLHDVGDFMIDNEYWIKPTRVPNNLWYNPDSPQHRHDTFSLTSNASRAKDNISEIIKTYFGMCLYETEDGEMLNNYNLEVYSAQELPVEPFNTLMFMGLQPNPIMHNAIRKSKLFISPYNGTSIPISVVDAIFLGTPVLMRDTITNREVFGLPDNAYFYRKKELAQKIKLYKEMSIEEIESIAKANINIGYMKKFEPEYSVKRLMSILSKKRVI